MKRRIVTHNHTFERPIPKQYKCAHCKRDLRIAQCEGGCKCNKNHNLSKYAVSKFRWAPEQLDEMRLEYSYYTAMRTKQDKE